ncbi:MAG: DM13 domain-containing protein [Bacteroidota bacterium]
MKQQRSLWGLALAAMVLVSSCIGDDFIDDSIAEQLRITAQVDSLAIGDSFQLEASFFNRLGAEEAVSLNWTSLDPNLVEVSSAGLMTGLAEGDARVTAWTERTNGDNVSDTLDVHIGQTTSGGVTARAGMLQTTSSYRLVGDFMMEQVGDKLVLSLDENYEASSSLPGLYLYLTNNPSTINNAVEVSKVTIFKGAHEFEISDVDLSEYNYVLYWCKPFGVKVGEGKFMD